MRMLLLLSLANARLNGKKMVTNLYVSRTDWKVRPKRVIAPYTKTLQTISFYS